MKRNGLIDFIRGLNLISMILFHGMWDVVYIFGIDIPWFRTWIRDVWQIIIAGTFVILSGYCFSLSHKKLKHGIKVSLSGIIITIVTCVLMPENRIIFGVLTMLGACMLIFIPLENILKKANPYVSVIVAFLLFVLTYNIDDGYIGIGRWIELPKVMYSNYVTTFIGLPFDEFYSTDYFGIIPWIFLYGCGFFLYKAVSNEMAKNDVEGKETSKLFRKVKNIYVKQINFIGKYSLIVYMMHQPVVYGVLWVVDSII